MMSTDNLLELLFSQSLDGFFFMMLDEPIRWDVESDKEQLLDYVFGHQRVTKVNGVMLAQYGAVHDQFLGLTPADLYRHDLEAGRRVWREFFDRGQLHIKTHERRLTARRSTSKATTSASTTPTAASLATSGSSATSPKRSGCSARWHSTPRSSRRLV